MSRARAMATPLGGSSMKKSIIGRRHGKEVAVSRSEDPFEVLQRNVDRMFEDFRRGSELDLPFGFAGTRGLDIQLPRVDVAETDEEVQVSAELPGIDEKDVEVTLGNHTLTIRGEKRTESEEKQKDYHVKERSYGSFHRVVTLPEGIDADKAKTCLAIKRTMNPGFAGIENELYYADNTLMVFGDAKAVVGNLVKELSDHGGIH